MEVGKILEVRAYSPIAQNCQCWVSLMQEQGYQLA